MKVNIGKFLKNTDRKIDIKIDNYDTWGLDNTLALIIFPALLQLKEQKHGVPAEFVNDVAEDYNDQMVFDFMREDKDAVFQQGIDKWNEILDKMLWSFQQLIDDDHDSKYHHGKRDYDWVVSDHKFTNPTTGLDEDCYEMLDKNPDGHWYDAVGHRLHNERIQEGLELFGRFFRDLWD